MIPATPAIQRSIARRIAEGPLTSLRAAAPSAPLYRAERRIAREQSVAQPAEIRTAIRLGAVAALMAFGIGLGQGMTARSAPVGEGATSFVATSDSGERDQVMMSVPQS